MAPSRPVPAPTTFVDRALGAPSPDASLERRLATGATLSIDGRGIDAHVGPATIALASRGTGNGTWQRYQDGVARATGFGRESILFGINRAEQFLTVDRRQGARRWSWQLDATNGVPHLGPDGGVTFTRAGHLVGFHILPVAILDRRGRNITPTGLRWSLDRHGSSWILGLRLDDKHLPVPYLIDPIALIAACGLAAGPGGTTSCTAATSTGSASLGITKPSGVVIGDVMVAQVTVRSSGAITAPAGWNQIGATVKDATSPIEQAVYWRLVDGTEPATITFTWAGGNADASGGIVTYKGVDPFIGIDASAVSSANSAGTAATGNPAGLAVTTSAANEMLQAAYAVANAVTVTQSGGQGLVREWTVSSTGATKVTAGFADGVQAAAGASGNKTATWVTSSLWAAHLFALKNESADGTGTVATSFTTASASQSGLTETLTYTPAAGSMANGDVSYVVPVGWTAPQTATPSAAGYVTATGGSGTNTITVTGAGPWTVDVSGVTLNQGSAQTLVMKYGDTGSGGPGATATATTGAVVWTTKERSSSRGALTNLAAMPTITVYAADGTGTMASSLSAVSGSQAGLTETLTWTAPAGGVTGATLTVDVPAGWTPPSTSAGAGFSTTSVGALSVSGQKITVTGIARTVGQTVVITYGSAGTATAAAGPGGQTWQTNEASTAGGVLTAIGASPSVTIYAPDGSGTATTPTTNVSASQTGNTVVFTYTVAAGGMLNGGVKLTIPAGWSAPSLVVNNVGYTTSTAGVVAVAGQVVTISGITLAAASTVTITYGSKVSGGAGATAAAATGAQTWQFTEASTAGGVFTNLGSSPSITVNAANGSGTLTASIAVVSASQTGRTITFTYTAAAGGTNNGAVTLVVPAGWSAPSTLNTDPGYTTASTGTVSVAGQAIKVSGVTLAGAATMTVVYGDTGGGGPGATAGSTTGPATWQAQEMSTAAGVLTNLAASPSITVYAADGSGTDTASIAVVSASQTGRTVTLTYTAAAGGMLNGSLTVAVPAGWTPPSTVAGAGFTTTSVGAVSVSGQTITISGVTRTGGQTVVVTYGSGGTATASAATGAQTWQVQEASTAAGVLTSIAASPSITVYAADGSGTLTTPTTNVSASQTGNTIVFTYTAAAGGLNAGTVTLVVPAGWSAPSTVVNANGYTTSTAGTVATAAQTITISNLTLAGGATATIVYGSTAGGGVGATAPAATGAQTWQMQERSTAAGVLTNIGASPSITINAANGTGTMTVLPANAGNGSTGNTLTFTYTAAAGGMSSGTVTVVAPAGWSAPSTAGAAAGYTTSSTGVVSVAGQTITVSGVTLAGAATMTIVYGSTGGGGPGATAGTTAGANSFQTQQRSTAAGVLTNIAASPSVNVYAADGSGTATASIAVVSASQTGRTVTLTYTAAAGGTSNGSLTVVVPAGWTPPSTVAGAGFTTTSVGAVSVSGQTITISGVTRTGGQTVVVTYGSGGTATASAATGAQTWQVQEASTAAGVLTSIAASPSITVYAADGSGTLTTPTTNVSASQTGNTIVFTYTAAAGGLNAGTVTLVVPAGWSAPSTVVNANGYTTSTAGTVATAAQTITISNLTLAGGATATIVYGSTAGGGVGATAPAATGAQTWQMQERSTAAGLLTNIGASPSITINAANGSGTMTTGTTNVSASQTGRTITFTYTAAAGGNNNGAVTVTAPAGWSPPSTAGAAAGYTTSSTGVVSVAGQTITVSGVTLAGAATMTIVYGSTGSGGPGATATATTGAQAWQAQERSTLAGVLTNLAVSPSFTVNAADGSGALTTPTSNVSASHTGNTIVFTYTAAAGGINSAAVTLVVPAGWSAPSTVLNANGYTTSSAGTVATAGQTITISSLTLAGGASATITYGSTAGGGVGATAPASTGAQTWQAQERSTAAGVLTNIGTSPSITINAADGTGTLTTGTSAVAASQSGRTITFTYTAAAGGMASGVLTMVAPAGWSAPSTTGSAAGYTTSSTGVVSVAGQTITVSGVTLAGAATMTVVYGDTGGGGPGATVTSTTGPQAWQAQQKSTAGGSLTNLGASPSITVYAADGSGTLTTGTSNVSASQTTRTITFTYTAAAGGITNGTVTLVVPAGWSAPSTTASAAGYTTASTGSVSATGQTITVSGVTLAGAATMTVVYGDTGGGGPGATATPTTGAQTWQAQEQSTPGSVLTNLAASPSITVRAADGTGTLTTPTANVGNGSTNTIVFTYTAATGGTSNGSVTLTAPAGWPAPTAGNTTSSLGARSYSGQTVTVSGVTLAAAATFTITYGPATGPTTGGPQTWSASEASTGPGVLTALGASPSINIYAADGSGALTGGTSPVGFGSAGNTESFTYVAAAGGISNGGVTIVVPAGWSAPSTTAGNPGFTGATTGTVAVAGQTITVSGVTLVGGGTMTIAYGSGAPGATAATVAGVQTWQAQSQATGGGTLTNLSASPSITVAPAPTLTTTSPAAAVLYGTATWTSSCASPGFCGTAADNSGTGLQKVELTIRQGSGNYWDGSSFSSASPVFVLATGTSSWSYSFPASTFPADGTYTVQARPMDNLNGVGTLVSTTFSIDVTPPSAFSLNAPTAAQAIRNGQTVSVPGGSPTDASGIAAVAFKACAGAGPCTFDTATVSIGSSVVSPYSATWNSQPADGPYKVVARATDNAGNTTDSPAVAVTVDNTPPVHAVTMPSGSGAYLSGTTMYFKSDAAGSFVLNDALTDATSGPASVDYPAVATAGWTHAAENTTTGPSYASSTFSWTASPSTPSGYVVTGHDVAGNTASQGVTFVSDTTAPAGGSVSYSGGFYNVASVPVTLADGTDAQSGVDTTSSGTELLQRASATLAAGACGSFGSFTTIATHPGVTDTDAGVASGNCYRYRYVVLDNVGNSVTYTSGATLKVDTDAPSAFSLSAPATGFVGPSATVSATAADVGGSGIAQIEFRYCAGGSCSFASGTTIGSPLSTAGFASQPWDLSSLTDGATYTLVARATDAAGNTTDSATTTVTLDSSPPTTTDNAPGGSQSTDTTVTLSPGDGSGSGVASTSWRVDGGGWHSGTSAIVPAPTDHSNDGSHAIDYYSVDNVGNTETVKHATVTIDTLPPSGAPVDPGSVLSGTVVLSDPSPTDSGAGVASVAFQYSPHGAGTWTTIGTAATSAPWSASFDTTTVADGQYDFRELISDAAVPANVATINLPGPKVIDNTAPSSAAVTAPAPGAFAGGIVTLGGSASDATSGVGQMVFKVNGTVVGTSSGSPTTVNWDSTSTPDGPVSVTVEAKDVAGNGPTVSSSRTFIVDNHPPTVTLDDPGAAVRGTVALTTTTSADTTQVTFQRSPAGAGTWTTISVDNTAPYGASLDTTLLTDGLYDLRAVATDGNNVVNSNIRTTRVDNTAPTGSVTAPPSAATIGGTSVSLKSNPADAGSGVATVQFRVDGTPIGTASSAPWTFVWDATSTPSGPHTIDAVVTDAAGNTFTTAAVPVTVDSTPPTVTLTDPGTPLSGTVTLHASSPDADTAKVDFQISPAGAGTWTTFATDTTPPTPYSGSFDTTTVGDGLYDFRAVAHDAVGNVSTPSVVVLRRIDNTPPSYVSAVPVDGSTIAAASSIVVTASEDLSAVTGSTLDGAATVAPTIAGATASYATGALADGPHTLAGTLVDLVGKTMPFTTHFTIISGPPPADWPYVEMNAFPGVPTTLASTDGGATVSTHSAIPSSTDHAVIRIDPAPPAVVGGGFSTGSPVYDVTAYWSLTGTPIHSFTTPLEIVLANPTADPTFVPATYENGNWRPLPLVPTAGVLPAGWSDGYFSGAGGIHILTTHLTQFTLLHDRFPPPPPTNVSGTVAANGLTLRWTPGNDPTGPIAQVQLYVNGAWWQSFDITQLETNVGPIAAGDSRIFTFTDTDPAGNVSASTNGLRALPSLAGHTVADATQALGIAGFALGTVTRVPSGAPAGTVLTPSDVQVLPLGSSIDLTVSAGPVGTKFVVRALTPTIFHPTRRRTIPASVAATGSGTAIVTLVDAHGHRIASWRRALHAGVNKMRLRISPKVRNQLILRPGRYALTWTATSSSTNDTASDRKRVFVVPRKTRR